jgi:hypothetical protein
MTKKTWTLTGDICPNVYVDRISIGPEDVGGPAGGYSVAKRTLRGGLRDGVDVIEVDNGRLRFVVLPTRGMGIWRAFCGDLHLGWTSPVQGPVNPAFVPLWEPSGLGWLSGFDELIVRCGLESNGAPEFRPDGTLLYPLHGKIANIPAHKVEVAIDGDSGEMAVSGVVEEARLFAPKLRLATTISTRAGEPSLTIADAITNLSAEPAELELFYHSNFGPPLAAPGSRILLPIKRLAPRDATAAADVPQWNVYGPESPGQPEVCHFIEPAADPSGQTRALLCSPAGDQGVSLLFDRRQMPCFTLWKNRQALADGYVTGLEPGINYPNPKSFEKQHGRVAQLAPGETRHFQLTLEAHPDAASLAAAQSAVAAIQKGTVPEVHQQPDLACSVNA